jgi:hypothetical protein
MNRRRTHVDRPMLYLNGWLGRSCGGLAIATGRLVVHKASSCRRPILEFASNASPALSIAPHVARL